MSTQDLRSRPSRVRDRLAAAIVLAGLPLVPVSPSLGSSGAVEIRLVDGTADSGIEIVTFSGSADKPHILESTGNGVLVLDYDGDGYQDLYFVAGYRLPKGSVGGEGSRLYRNRGDGSFEDVTERAGAGLAIYGQGGCVGDVDADGWPDVYVTAFGGDVLLRNQGDGTFADGTADAGLGQEHAWGVGCALFDADADGDPDLYVARYIEATWDDVSAARRTRMWRGRVPVMDGPRGLPEAGNRFYLNDGAGRFREATAAAGLAEGGAEYSMDVAAFDFDHDLLPDLYVANDSTPNRLYRNLGAGRFEEIGTWAGCAFNADGSAQGSMGIGVGDFDGNRWLDLVVTNFAHDYSALYRNLDGRFFEDGSFTAGLAVPTYRPLGWAAVPLDVELDGDLDLFLANGHIYPQVDDDPSLEESFRQPNQLLVNEGGRFEPAELAEPYGLGPVESSRGGVVLDLENDGDEDLVIGHQDTRPTLLMNETLSGNGWLGVSLRLGGSERLEPGTRLTLTTDRVTRVRQQISGGGYASQSDGRVRFGLGRSTVVERLEIAFPAGGRLRLTGLEAGWYYVIERRSGR